MARAKELFNFGSRRPNATSQLTACCFKKMKIKTHVAPRKLKVPSSSLPKLSGDLNAATPAFSSTPPVITPRHRQTNTPATSWITASARHGLGDNMGQKVLKPPASGHEKVGGIFYDLAAGVGSTGNGAGPEFLVGSGRIRSDSVGFGLTATGEGFSDNSGSMKSGSGKSNLMQ